MDGQGGWCSRNPKGQDLFGASQKGVQDFFHQPYPLKVKSWKMIHVLLIWSLFGGLTVRSVLACLHGL